MSISDQKGAIAVSDTIGNDDGINVADPEKRIIPFELNLKFDHRAAEIEDHHMIDQSQQNCLMRLLGPNNNFCFCSLFQNSQCSLVAYLLPKFIILNDHMDSIIESLPTRLSLTLPKKKHPKKINWIKNFAKSEKLSNYGSNKSFKLRNKQNLSFDF
ncbi:hypothetical protein BpHYR1_036987 [Brachionus plicatilis]|uniref:Uncharacterized protein n=1 Tax=Brachionus plicatilis TaxID=10195 RepID=A0A3M7SXS0_BRAPC|nr:hypothetical protein BpHYR1_036987 [Brachionus plicatilis]